MSRRVVSPGCEWLVDHLPDERRLQLREVVDVLAGVLAVGDAEAEVEVERLQVAIPKKYQRGK